MSDNLILLDTTVKGNITATKHVTDGGTDSQVVLGNGDLKDISDLKSGYSGTGMQLVTGEGKYIERSEAYVYGICSTAGSEKAKTVTMAGFKKVAYCRVCIKFTNTNTSSSPTLNINSTGAAYIKYNNTNIVSGQLKANHTYDFVYVDSAWQLVGELDTNTDTVFSTADIHGTCETDGSAVAKTVTISGYEEEDYGRVCITFKNTNTASSPTLQVNNNSAYPIKYNNTNIVSGQLKANHTYDFILILSGSTANDWYWQVVGELASDMDSFIEWYKQPPFKVQWEDLTTTQIEYTNPSELHDFTYVIIDALRANRGNIFCKIGGVTGSGYHPAIDLLVLYQTAQPFMQLHTGKTLKIFLAVGDTSGLHSNPLLVVRGIRNADAYSTVLLHRDRGTTTERNDDFWYQCVISIDFMLNIGDGFVHPYISAVKCI